MVTLIAWMFLWAPGSSAPVGLDQFGTAHEPTTPGSGYTVIDFAASWCKPCWKALPHVQALADSRSDVRVLVISVDQKESGRDRLVEKLGLTLPVVWDQGHRWAAHYDPPGMPTSMIVDQNGKVVYQHVGWSKASWQKLLAELERLPVPNGKLAVP